MKDKSVLELINMNNRLLMLLGMTTHMLQVHFKNYPESKKSDYHWFMDAIDEVVYKNNPIPPFPDEVYGYDKN